jgi:hypothetical protein
MTPGAVFMDRTTDECKGGLNAKQGVFSDSKAVGKNAKPDGAALRCFSQSYPEL